MVIAINLGHKDATLVLKVYGKYRPTRMQLAAMELKKLGAKNGANRHDFDGSSPDMAVHGKMHK